MPWLIKDEGEGVDDRWCIYKKGPEGEPEGESLGCHPSKPEAARQLAALYANVEDAKVKALDFPDGVHKLLVLATPYGGPDNGKDWQGEYFDDETDFMTELGESRPIIYFHGLQPSGRKQARPEVIGTGIAVRRDENGMWFEVLLEKGKALVERLWEAALKGLVRASTGSLSHLVRRAKDGHLLTWPIGEISLLDIGTGREPANDYATVVPLKSLFTEAGLEPPEWVIKADEAEVTQSVEPIQPRVKIVTQTEVVKRLPIKRG